MLGSTTHPGHSNLRLPHAHVAVIVVDGIPELPYHLPVRETRAKS